MKPKIKPIPRPAFQRPTFDTLTIHKPIIPETKVTFGDKTLNLSLTKKKGKK